MKRIFYIIVLFAFLTLYAKAQRSAIVEMRYFTSDVKANGDTDFHGETEWMNLAQRVDFLNKYATYSSIFWGNPQLDKPLLATKEAKGVLQKIKPQPLTNIRRTLRLVDWQAYGYSPDKAEEKKKQWTLWTSTPGTSIVNGNLKLKNCVVERGVEKMDWRFKFSTTLTTLGPDFVLAFQKGDKTLLSVELGAGKIVMQSGQHKRSGKFGGVSTVKLQVYGDLSNHCFFCDR